MPSAPEVNPHRRLLLVVIDGLGAAPLRLALAEGHAPHIQTLIDAGARFDDAISPFPSLTPVCLATIITGVGPDRHRIPSLGWYDRGRDRFVEYGSSFAAASVEGTWRGVQDVVVDLNHLHLAEDPPTLFERVQDAGKRAASINYLVSRGRTRHTMKHNYGPARAVGKAVGVTSIYGPDHLYFGELYGSLKPLLPQVGFKRPKDWGGGHIARYLMRNTGVEFVVLYLGEHDHKSHQLGPDSTQQAISVADRALGRAMSSLGGTEAFLDQFAVVLCADHGQTHVHEHAALEDVFDDVTLFRGSRTSNARDCDLAVIGSNRVAMAYRTRQLHHNHARASEPGYIDGPNDRWIAERALECPANDLSIYADGGEFVVLGGGPGGGELRARRDPDGGQPTVRSRATGDDSDRWQVSGDLELLDLEIDPDDGGVLRFGDYPDALQRIASALGCVNTGDVLFSSKPGWEFHDIGGKAHSGGSHGSLHRTDSTAPLISIGLEGATPDHLGTVRLTDIAALATSHLGIDVPIAAGVARSGS
ncbi:MAG: type phosphodiesterase/nucleotide pyrophosphatase [Thermoleophilia bacterium]|nr:type phosphodiesterase/nucleotide pyrophosphatase [Thermoleophilia bacterium]